MKKFGKKLLATVLTATLVIGSIGVVSAQSNGQNVSAGRAWKSYSIFTHEDHINGESKAKMNVCWYHSLINTGDTLKDQHYVDDKVTDAQIAALNKAIDKKNVENKKNKRPLIPNVTKHSDRWGDQDSHKTFGENAKIIKQTDSSFTMDVINSGWSAYWTPQGKCVGSNPWGIDATKVVPVERGRYYTISFSIFSSCKHQDEIEKKRSDDTYYNDKADTWTYTKHFHIKAYDNTDPEGAALPVQSIKATNAGKNRLGKSKDFNNLIALNANDKDYTNVSMTVLVPNDKKDYQAKAKSATMGIKLALGAFLYEYIKETGMTGQIDVKNFKVTAGNKAATAGKAKIKSVKASKKKLKIKYKASGAKKFQVQVALKKNFKKGLKKKTTTKKTWTFKGLKKKKKYYIRVRGAKYYKGVYIWGKWSKVKKKKTK